VRAQVADALSDELREASRGLDPLAPILAQPHQDDACRLLGRAAQGRNLRAHVLEHRRHRRLGRKRRTALEHLVEDRGQRVDVGAVIER
jgi:hypothetical protein